MFCNNQCTQSDIQMEGENLCPGISVFFAGKTLAITGGTGFLGQGIIEKILRCCPDVKKIILLIRKKGDLEPKKRLEDFIKLPVFSTLRENESNFAEKLSFISCDLATEDLGLNRDSRKVLQRETDIFIHSAATLRFNEKLRLSFEINVQSLRRLLKICKAMPQLQAFVHISSAYAHCDRYKIREQFYECGVDYLDLQSALRCMNDEAIQDATPHILGNKPNTYVMTKALAEDVIARESGNLPVCVIRPSMVIPAWQEPMPGWCTNVYGPTAFFVGYGKGILRTVIADPNAVADLIPVDIVVSGVIAATAKTAFDFINKKHSLSDEERKSDDIAFLDDESDEFDLGTSTGGTIVNIHRRIPIYNLTTGSQNPLHISDLVKYGQHWYDEYPLDPLRVPEVSVTCNRYFHKFTLLLHQTLPAYVFDALAIISSKESGMLKLNHKLIAGMNVMTFFFTNQWRWVDENAQNLQKTLSPQDRKIFNFDPKSFTWKEHIKRYVMGTRKYLVKEDMDGYPAARRSVERLRTMNRCLDSAAAVCVVGLVTLTGIAGYAVDAITTLCCYTLGYF